MEFAEGLEQRLRWLTLKVVKLSWQQHQRQYLSSHSSYTEGEKWEAVCSDVGGGTAMWNACYFPDCRFASLLCNKLSGKRTFYFWRVSGSGRAGTAQPYLLFRSPDCRPWGWGVPFRTAGGHIYSQCNDCSLRLWNSKQFASLTALWRQSISGRRSLI